MSPAIVRIGERVWSMRAPLAAWARGKKARFADLHALRRGRLPAVVCRVPPRTGYDYLFGILALRPQIRVVGRARNPVNFFKAGHHVR
jgi:hypothetical protein